MNIQLSDHFTYKRLLRFVLPSILMIMCTSVYSIVDGFFVSNFVGTTPFAAINLTFPVLMAVASIGFMAGTEAVLWCQRPWEKVTGSVPMSTLP